MKMLTKTFAASALAVAGAGLAVPASAAVQSSTAVHAPAAVHSPFTSVAQWSDMSFEHKRKRHRHYRDDYGRRGYDEPVYRDTRVWRDRDGEYRCRKTDGTIGMIVGGAAGAILGREIDGGRDRTLGTVLGAAGGAILGKQVMSRTRCR